MQTTRAERRRLTEERILASARKLFAEEGFERTTIRAVATAADIDPALVMQYFGSKQGLFSRAVEVSTPPNAQDEPTEVELVDQILGALEVKLAGLPPASLAMLRSMLTHPEAAAGAHTALNRHIDQLASATPAPDAVLRATLAVSMMLGIAISHQLLALPPLVDAAFPDIEALLRPSLQALMESAQPTQASATDPT